MPGSIKTNSTPLQWVGFGIYLGSTVLALWVSLSQIHGDGFLIIVLCLPGILMGMLLMVLGGRR